MLNHEFQKEIEDGRMFPMQAEKGLATIAIVGENMKHTPGIAGKLFGTLGRSGISVIACAQGASETNISFVINENYLRKALNSIHDSFFLSEYQEVNLFICGVGTVGGSLLEQIRQQQEKLMRELRVKLNVVGIASGHNAMFTREGIEPGEFREQLDAAPPSNIQRLHDEVIGMNIFNSVFVDCTASPEVAGLYADFLEHNINVVAANKIAASSDYANYRRLKETSQKRGVKFLFETNVGAGLPIIRTINDLCNSGDKILRIEAVLSGTLNFIFNTISKDIPFSETVRMAKEEGYSEPDPRIDLSGKDVIRKLVILAREAGYEISRKMWRPSSSFRSRSSTARSTTSGRTCLRSMPTSRLAARSWTRNRRKYGASWQSSRTARPASRWKSSTPTIHSMCSRGRTTSSCSPPSATTNTPCSFRATAQAPV